MADKNERPIKVVAENRKARFNYAIEDTIEAGISLTGTEVKSIRSGKSTIAESYADSKDGEIWLINANIPVYLQANRFNHAFYKEGAGSPHERLKHESNAFAWLRHTIGILSESSNPEEFLEHTKLELFHDQVFC